MKKIFSITGTVLALLFFISCDKTKLGDPVACIDTGNADFKTGKDTYFMNCSENFAYSDWKVFDANNNELYTSLSDTMRHLAYTFPNPGNYKVSLKVWFSDTLVNAQTELDVTAVAP